MTPVYWAYDHALHLYPLPDLIVICDKFKSITDTIADCTVINPVSDTTISMKTLQWALFLTRVHLQLTNTASRFIYRQREKWKIVRLVASRGARKEEKYIFCCE